MEISLRKNRRLLQKAVQTGRLGAYNRHLFTPTREAPYELRTGPKGTHSPSALKYGSLRAFWAPLPGSAMLSSRLSRSYMSFFQPHSSNFVYGLNFSLDGRNGPMGPGCSLAPGRYVSSPREITSSRSPFCGMEEYGLSTESAQPPQFRRKYP